MKIDSNKDPDVSCHADDDSVEMMVFEGGRKKNANKANKSNKASTDSVSDHGHENPSKSKTIKRRNLEGGEGSGDSHKKNLLDPRFSKGEILRENTKKTGLKSFKEDKKKGSKKGKDSSRGDGSKKSSSKGKTVQEVNIPPH